MRVLVISATSAIMATAAIAAAAERQNEGIQILVVDESASIRGILDEPKLYLPIVARGDEDCWPSVRFLSEPLPRAPKLITANPTNRGTVRLYNKHDYG